MTDQRPRGGAQPATEPAGDRPRLVLAGADAAATWGADNAGVRAGLRGHVSRWGSVYLVALLTRLGVLAVGMIATYKSTGAGLAHVPFTQAGTYPHYVDVVTHGYSLKNATEFPLLPLLLAPLHAVGLSMGVAALLVSNLLFVAGLVAFASLGARYVGASASRRAALYLAIFPTAWWFSIASTESAMLATLCLSAVCALRGTTRWWLAAGTFAALCALSRPPAMFVGFVLLGIAVAQWRAGTLRGPRLAVAIAAMAAVPVAVGAFFAYLGARLGDPLATFHAQDDFGRHMTAAGPLHAVTGALRDVSNHVLGPGFELAAAFVVIALTAWFFLTAAGERWEVRGWTAFAVCSLLLPLATGIVWQMPRFALLVPPAFWVLGRLGRRHAWLHQAAIVLLPMALATQLIFSITGVTR